MRKIGLEDFTFTEVYDKEKMNDGRRLAELERRSRQRELSDKMRSGDIEIGSK